MTNLQRTFGRLQRRQLSIKMSLCRSQSLAHQNHPPLNPLYKSSFLKKLLRQLFLKGSAHSQSSVRIRMMMIALKLVNNILFFKIYFNLSLSNNPPGVYFRVVSKIGLPWLPACRDAPYITVSYHCLGKVAIRSLFLVTDTYSRPIFFWKGGG